MAPSDRFALSKMLRAIRPPSGDAAGAWGFGCGVKAPDGGIMGVYSLSEGKALKVAGFSFADREFEGAALYSDWKFLYSPGGQQAPIRPQPPVSSAR